MPTLITPPSDSNHVSPQFTLGGLYPYNGQWYRYVQFLDAVTYAVGQIVYWGNATGTAVTNDVSGGSGVGTDCAGVVMDIMTQNYYGFVAVTGVHTFLTSGADDIAAGEQLFTTGDGTVDGAAAGTVTSTRVGIALAADVDAANTVVGRLGIHF